MDWKFRIQRMWGHLSVMTSTADDVAVAEYQDAGQAFYAADFWSLWDLTIVACGIAFFVTSMNLTPTEL
jgi:hypothetical protein